MSSGDGEQGKTRRHTIYRVIHSGASSAIRIIIQTLKTTLLDNHYRALEMYIHNRQIIIHTLPSTQILNARRQRQRYENRNMAITGQTIIIRSYPDNPNGS